ncbi:bifunctional orotidine-5'-phosphate decarboxylase/orotate phosphoribosyltransferase [Oscillatoria acuminata]|uniref:Orotate phosphoribosyltransferase n=1 Tax=Oscillatoria acuminata PCC 6304 TaxID=56110 RepID=K9TPR3_9CYAN|nr:orotate phosphoribosyltransferase [Oscillatoria acuminata PCC 6304]
MINFSDKLQTAIERNNSLLCVGLDPDPEALPSRFGTPNNPATVIAHLTDWLHFIIAQTSELVCAYKPTLGFYTALGAEGLNLLPQILQAIPRCLPVILDVKHSDLNSSTVFAQTIFERWQVDAVTLSPYPGQDLAAPFLLYPDKAVFVLCHTSNPAAQVLQHYPKNDAPLYLQVVKETRTWGTPEQVAIEVGTNTPEVLGRVRSVAPERLILARSIWSEGTVLANILQNGLNSQGDGLILPVPQDYLSSENAGSLILGLRETINQVRIRIPSEAQACPVWFPDVPATDAHPHTDLILQLYDLGCIMFGEYVQASGETFPYYVDLRTIISNPQIFDKIIGAYAEVLTTLKFDRIAGIPYGALPTATGLSLRLNYPMIFPRKEVKAHGTRRLVEGHFNPGETVVVVDDILISGKSAMEGAQKLQSTGLKVEDIVVFIDHEKGVKDRLKMNGYRAHSVLTLSEIAETLYDAGRLTDRQFQFFKDSH